MLGHKGPALQLADLSGWTVGLTAHRTTGSATTASTTTPHTTTPFSSTSLDTHPHHCTQLRRSRSLALAMTTWTTPLVLILQAMAPRGIAAVVDLDLRFPRGVDPSITFHPSTTTMLC